MWLLLLGQTSAGFWFYILQRIGTFYQLDNLWCWLMTTLAEALLYRILVINSIRCIADGDPEILGSPTLTWIATHQAVREIVRASRREAFVVASEAESFCINVKEKIRSAGKRGKETSLVSMVTHVGSLDLGRRSNGSVSGESQLECWEQLLLRLSEMKRYRRIIGSIAESCLKSATPLLASVKESTCLVALDIVQDATTVLVKVEDYYKHEKGAKQAIAGEIELCSSQRPQDIIDMSDEGIEENHVLPAMNKIWLYLVICAKNRTSVTIHEA